MTGEPHRPRQANTLSSPDCGGPAQRRRPCRTGSSQTRQTRDGPRTTDLEDIRAPWRYRAWDRCRGAKSRGAGAVCGSLLGRRRELRVAGSPITSHALAKGESVRAEARRLVCRVKSCVEMLHRVLQPSSQTVMGMARRLTDLKIPSRIRDLLPLGVLVDSREKCTSQSLHLEPMWGRGSLVGAGNGSIALYERTVQPAR